MQYIAHILILTVQIVYLPKPSYSHQKVHFWIGNECSVDEQAVAAIKVTLSSFLFSEQLG